MKISRTKLEEEMNSLLNAAKSTNSRNTALGYLQEAKNKIYGYDIPSSLEREYLSKIEDVADDLGLSL